MNIEQAQKDMCQSYFGGGPGILISGIVWMTAGLVSQFYSPKTSISVFKRSGIHDKTNLLGKLAMETTVLLFVGLFLAYAIFQYNENWFYPVMLLIIGARYLMFQSLYGKKMFWFLGAALIFTGFISIMMQLGFQLPVLLGGAIEIVFGVGAILNELRKEQQLK